MYAGSKALFAERGSNLQLPDYRWGMLSCNSHFYAKWACDDRGKQSLPFSRASLCYQMQMLSYRCTCRLVMLPELLGEMLLRKVQHCNR